MDKIAKHSKQSKPDDLSPLDEGDELAFKPMSAQEATAWRLKQRPVSMWRVVRWQLGATCLVGALVWVLTGQWTLALSASYGGIAVVLPVTVMIWGMTAGRLARLLSVFAKSSLLALVFWEGVKLVLSVLMLALAPVVLKNLNWLALVAGFVLVIKVYWLALFVQSKTS
jgi:ATP synthase protein I